MQTLLLSPKERLRHWKEFRTEVSKINDMKQQLLKVQHYWQMQPEVSRYLDVDNPSLWPAPWELIYEGNYCQAAKAYLMEQTLLMVDETLYAPEKLQLVYLQNPKVCDYFMVVIFDNKYVLNYNLDTIVEYSDIRDECLVAQYYTTSANHKHTIKK